MGRVRKVSGEHVMSETEFVAWWSESEHLQGEVFIDLLRRHLARQLKVENFRRLVLVCGDRMLSVHSHWIDAELTVVIRPYVTEPDDGKALVQAVLNRDLARVVGLLERPLNPDTEAVDPHDSDDEDGRRMRPLQLAACSGDLEILRCLLQAGADKDKADHDGKTPIHLAVWSDHLEVVRCLLQAGADKHKADRDGNTPMHRAAFSGHLEVLRCLLQAGADKDKADHDGRTPIQMAVWSDHLEVVRCLLQAGADKDKADHDGKTPMHLAAWAGYQEVARGLLQAPNIKSQPEPSM
ncbi:unnamed protein product [Effrenium voratum]|nr:unnamed protein product [Effrenium voratum]